MSAYGLPIVLGMDVNGDSKESKSWLLDEISVNVSNPPGDVIRSEKMLSLKRWDDVKKSWAVDGACCDD
ncbi:hypothetical protein RRF57_009683 [Xylaria bambusicola]|uniref:Uncharacterized protein n=1 Tax=Xylaria bambusicola TaxID=326684 RepID=A0AAN7UTV6_9PEZI